jgi:mono/diheme cytochrome c family protein
MTANHGVFLVGFAVAATSGGSALAQTTSAPVTPERAMFSDYCVVCHNDMRVTGGLSLEHVDLSRLAVDADETEVWENIARKLRTRAMPPPGRQRPSESQYETVAARVETELDAAAEAAPNPGRRPAVHRLNRAEYTNTIRDLFALEVDGAVLLPADDSGYGFDNIADVLSVSPMLTERYLAAARKISRLAVGDLALAPSTDIFEVNKYLHQDARVSEDLPFGSRGGMAARHTFPVDAEYVVKIYLSRTYDGRIRGLAERHQLEVRLDGVLVAELEVGGPLPPDENGRPRRRDYRNEPDDGQEVRFTATAGPHLLGVSFVGRAPVLEGMHRPHYAITSYEYAGDQTLDPGVGRVELSGPYNVTGRGDTPSRRAIFTCRPPPNVVASGPEEVACASEILGRLGRFAFRRPVTEADLEMLIEFFHSGRAVADFDAGIEMALRRVLMSPDFLFRRESDPDGAAPGQPYAISELELASRLSFFLWSSIPDGELLDLAERGELRRPRVLDQQVARMLADPRARALVDNFGGQWLYLRNMELVSPDPYAFPDFDGNLRVAMTREMELFLESQIREDHSVLELMTSDQTFVNQRLAEHYGIPNILGNHFRRITLSGELDRRRGLLGKGSLLTVTSYAHRTSPVLRGKWLLENVLGTPPPPPPPDVPELTEEAEADGSILSLRERMEAHRSDPVCASCHRVMDPLGFALENFDGIGQWRATSEAGTPIDASGELADGTPVDGPVSLRNALLKRPENFVTTVTEKLMTYGLGRGVEYYDASAVRRIVRGAAVDGYTWSALITGIARSVPFQMRSSAP